jgi:hypothetical protein
MRATSAAPAEPTKLANAVFVLIAPPLRANAGPESPVRVIAQKDAPQPVSAFLDPVAVLVPLVFLLHGAPGDAVGAILLSVLLLRGVERLLVDLLGVLGEIVLHIIRELRYLPVGNPAPPIWWPLLRPLCTLEGAQPTFARRQKRAIV